MAKKFKLLTTAKSTEVSLCSKYNSGANKQTEFEIVKDVLEYVKSKNYKFIDIDGVRVQFEDGWALVRASNTGPNLTIRFEAKDENRLKEIQEEFENVINEEKKKFNL